MKPDNQHSHSNVVVSIPAGIAWQMRKWKLSPFAYICKGTFLFFRGDKMNGAKTKKAISDENLKTLLSSINLIRYGSVTVVIQDGTVVQIETHEKMRLV